MASHQQVAHRWAQDDGRIVKGFNLFYTRRNSRFFGDTDVQTIFSYGMHFIRAVRARGEAWRAPPAAPIRVGHFQVDYIDAEGNMRAGCHYFAWADMLALAEREGV